MKNVRTAILLLAGASAILLAIAGLAAATIQSAGRDRREHELAIRIALGASVSQLSRLVLLDVAGTAVVTAIAGLALSEAALGGARRWGATTVPELLSIHLDWTVVVVATAIASLAALCSFAAPMISVIHSDTAELLRRTGNTASSSAKVVAFRDALTAMSIGVTLILIISFAVAADTLLGLVRVDTGFITRNVVVGSVRLPMPIVTPVEAERIRSFMGAFATWVSLAVAADLAVYVVHGWRWTTLLVPVARVGFWRTVQAIYIGLFANEVLPLRTGEIIRCYLLAHWNDLRLSLTFASAGLERTIDGVWMLAAFFVTASFVHGIPRDLTILVQALALLLVIGAGILFWIVMHKHHAHAVLSESRWSATLRHIVEGLHLMGRPRTLGLTAAISLLYLALQILSVFALMRAYGLDLSFWVAGGVLTLVRLSTVVPNAPGNLGLINLACVMALGLFEVEKTDAKTFSIILFVSLTVPLLIGGRVGTAPPGLNISELHDRARQRATQTGK